MLAKISGLFSQRRGSALVEVCKKGNQVKAARLVRRGVPEHHKKLAMALAIVFGHPELVTLLLENGVDANGSGHTGTPWIITAVEFARPEIVVILLNRGADINAINSNGDSPLIIACRRDGIGAKLKSDNFNCELIELLLIAGASVNLKNNRGQSPLSVTSFRWPEQAKLLTRYGAT